MLDRSAVFKEIKKTSQKLLQEVKAENEILDKLCEYYEKENIEKIKEKCKDKINYKLREIAWPVEEEKKKNLLEFEEEKIKLKENSWVFDLIKNEKVLAIDTSEMIPDPHIWPYIFLINLGYFFYDYSLNKYSENNKAIIYTREDLKEELGHPKFPSWALIYFRLKEERSLIDELNSEIGINDTFVFLDESFSSGFLSSMKEEIIEKIMNELSLNVENIKSKGALPIAVFYSRSQSFMELMSISLGIETKVTDANFFNRILRTGQRSPLFQVLNIPCSKLDYKIYCFYIKISEGNVLRIELFEDEVRRIDEIHSIVLLQSIIGEGYPYCMQRAHERALISSEDKNFIFNAINMLLPENIQIKISKKLEKKISKLI